MIKFKIILTTIFHFVLWDAVCYAESPDVSKNDISVSASLVANKERTLKIEVTNNSDTTITLSCTGLFLYEKAELYNNIHYQFPGKTPCEHTHLAPKKKFIELWKYKPIKSVPGINISGPDQKYKLGVWYFFPVHPEENRNLLFQNSNEFLLP